MIQEKVKLNHGLDKMRPRITHYYDGLNRKATFSKTLYPTYSYIFLQTRNF